MGVRVQLDVNDGCVGYGSLCQARVREVAIPSDHEESDVVPLSDWLVLPQIEIDSARNYVPSCPTSVDATYGEEDGLRPGCTYIFSVRVGDRRRRSQWSLGSLPVVMSMP